MTSVARKPAAAGSARLKSYAGGTPQLHSGFQSEVGRLLQQMYRDLLKEPVPSRFKDILSKLDERSEARS